MKKKGWRQLIDEISQAVDLEMEISVGSSLKFESGCQNSAVNARLMQKLKELRRDTGNGNLHSRDAFKEQIRTKLIEEINVLSGSLLELAEQGILELRAQEVSLWIDISNGAVEPRYEEFSFEVLPFLTSMPKALEVSRKLREFRYPVQWKALNFIHAWWRLGEANFWMDKEGLEDDLLHPIPKTRLRKAQAAAQRQVKRLEAELPSGVLNLVKDFYSCLLGNTTEPYALPIEVATQSSQAQVRQMAGVCDSFGYLLCPADKVKFTGHAAGVAKAVKAWDQYQKAGVGLREVAAWLRVLDLTRTKRVCSVCFRHASAKSRCHEHITKGHENSLARRDKKVRLLFEKKMAAYLVQPYVRLLMQRGFSWPDPASQELEEAAHKFSAEVWLQERILFLARQLRMLIPIFSNEQVTDVGRLFEYMLEAAKELDALAQMSNKAHVREEIRAELRELISVKGVLQMLCGHGTYSVRVNLQMFGWDRNHPVLNQAAAAPIELVKLVLQQRAWAEACQEFQRLTMPEAHHIRTLLAQGKSKKEAATLLGISLSGLYKILSRGDQPRERQYLGKDRLRDSL